MKIEDKIDKMEDKVDTMEDKRVIMVVSKETPGPGLMQVRMLNTAREGQKREVRDCDRLPE